MAELFTYFLIPIKRQNFVHSNRFANKYKSKRLNWIYRTIQSYPTTAWWMQCLLSPKFILNWLYAQLHYFLNFSQLLVSCLPLLAKLI